MLIEKETVIKELNEFADSLTVIGGSYIRSPIRVVIDPMNESPEAAELAELKHKVAVQDAAVKKLFDAMAKEPPQTIRCKDCVYHNPDDMVDWCDAWGNDTTDDAFCSYAERRQNG